MKVLLGFQFQVEIQAKFFLNFSFDNIFDLYATILKLRITKKKTKLHLIYFTLTKKIKRLIRVSDRGLYSSFDLDQL